MPGSVSVVIFGAIMFIAMALIYAFSGGSLLITERLGRLWRPPGQEQAGLKEIAPEIDSTRSSPGSPRLLPFLIRTKLRKQTSVWYGRASGGPKRRRPFASRGLL